MLNNTYFNYVSTVHLKLFDEISFYLPALYLLYYYYYVSFIYSVT